MKENRDEFICRNCGFEIKLAQVEYYEAFSKKAVYEGQLNDDDYSDCYHPSGMEVVIQDHACDEPRFSTEDEYFLMDTIGLPEGYWITEEQKKQTEEGEK